MRRELHGTNNWEHALFPNLWCKVIHFTYTIPVKYELHVWTKLNNPKSSIILFQFVGRLKWQLLIPLIVTGITNPNILVWVHLGWSLARERGGSGFLRYLLVTLYRMKWHVYNIIYKLNLQWVHVIRALEVCVYFSNLTYKHHTEDLRG